MIRPSSSHPPEQRVAVVYECPGCEQRSLDLGKRRCPDCQQFGRIDQGGSYPHRDDEPVAINDLAQTASDQQVSKLAH